MQSTTILRVFHRITSKARLPVHSQYQSLRCLSYRRYSSPPHLQNGGSSSTYSSGLLALTKTRSTCFGISYRFYSSEIEIDDNEYTIIRDELKKFIMEQNTMKKQPEKFEIELDKILKLHQCGALDGGQIELSPKELTILASGIYQIKEKVPGAVYISTPLFHSAAVGGYSPAKYTYAEMLRTGEGVAMDVKEAIRLFTELAEHENHPLAKFSVASYNYYGIGMKKDVLKALELYQQCAASGILLAYTMIGNIYFEGKYVEQDLEKAVECYKKAADAEDPAAFVALAHCHTHGKGGLAVNHKLAYQYHSRAAKEGHPLALFNLGVHHFSGKGTPQDYKKAAEYWHQASDLGVPSAQVNLGNMYYNGLGVKEDWNKAKALYEAAAPHNSNARSLLKELRQQMKKLEK